MSPAAMQVTQGTRTRRSTRREPSPTPAPQPVIPAPQSRELKVTTTQEQRPRVRPAWNTEMRIEPTKNEIRDRAYFLYLARGGEQGDPQADWLEAERQLREELQRTAWSGRS